MVNICCLILKFGFVKSHVIWRSENNVGRFSSRFSSISGTIHHLRHKRYKTDTNCFKKGKHKNKSLNEGWIRHYVSQTYGALVVCCIYAPKRLGELSIQSLLVVFLTWYKPYASLTYRLLWILNIFMKNLWKILKNIGSTERHSSWRMFILIVALEYL